MTVQTPEVKPLSEIVPKEFHERPYLKDLLAKPQDAATFAEVFKKLDGAESLLGKKGGIPADDAKPEEWEGFFTKLRPAKEDDYEVKAAPNAKPDPEFAKALRSAFHKAGVSKAQAARFQDELLPTLAAQSKAAADARAKTDADTNREFEAIAKTTLGDEFKPKLARVQAALKDHVPAALQPFVAKLGNNEMVILAQVVNTLMEKWIPEDKLKQEGSGGGSAESAEDLRKQAREVMKSKEFTDEFHPDHAKTVAKKDELYRRLGALGAKK